MAHETYNTNAGSDPRLSKTNWDFFFKIQIFDQKRPYTIGPSSAQTLSADKTILLYENGSIPSLQAISTEIVRQHTEMASESQILARRRRLARVFINFAIFQIFGLHRPGIALTKTFSVQKLQASPSAGIQLHIVMRVLTQAY